MLDIKIALEDKDFTKDLNSFRFTDGIVGYLLKLGNSKYSDILEDQDLKLVTGNIRDEFLRESDIFDQYLIDDTTQKLDSSVI